MEVARRPLADRHVCVRHQQGGSTSQRSARREPGERSNARPAKSLLTLEGKIAATACTQNRARWRPRRL
eukprot:953982-Prymnesium_polylepis.1